MRLGDLDALYDKVSDHVTSVSVCATAQQAIGQTDFKRRCLEDIHNAPTIDAVPVKWLNERHRKCCEEGDTDLMDAITVLCNEYHVWQKEQEAKTCG